MVKKILMIDGLNLVRSIDVEVVYEKKIDLHEK